jgi:uncharacterized protein YodC (DUF2158 family)
MLKRCKCAKISPQKGTSMFKPGDVVTLKSGGPKMTVAWCEDQNGTPQAYCEWFEGSKKMGSTFAPTSLEQVATESASHRFGSRGSGGTGSWMD